MRDLQKRVRIFLLREVTSRLMIINVIVLLENYYYTLILRYMMLIKECLLD